MTKDNIKSINNYQEEKKVKIANSSSSPTMRFVRKAFEYYDLTLRGDGSVINKKGKIQKRPLDKVELFYDMQRHNKDCDAEPRAFEAAFNELCENAKDLAHAKIIDEFGCYISDPQENLEQAARIMLSGLDFELAENKERLFRLKWGINNQILQIKRKMHGLQIFDHKVLILVGSNQGDQKSEFMLRLIKPLSYLQDKISLDDIVDNSRNFARFVDNYALFCDELEGNQKDYKTIKDIITSPTISPRILGTQRILKLSNNATLFGCANFPSYTIFKDTSGSRRYQDIEITKDSDFSRFRKLNSIDWNALFKSIPYIYNQQEIEAYLKVREDRISPYQKENAFRDIMDEFIEENSIVQGKNFVKSNWLHQELVLYIEYKRYAQKPPSVQVFGGQLSRKYGIEGKRSTCGNHRGYYIDLPAFKANQKRNQTQF